jgi:hypothetical protein
MIKNNDRCVLAIESTPVSPSPEDASIEFEEHLRSDTICPHCRVALIRLGSCFSCPICGFGGCD